jgi:molybdopterin molybdotransferase
VITLEEALSVVLESCQPLAAREVELLDALGLVLAEPAHAAENVPPFANSAMDGYAVRAGDLVGASEENPVCLRVIGTLAAGAVPSVSVGHNEALRIMTGAPFPEGADSVAIVETTRAEGDRVWISSPVKPGQHVRAAGDDVRAGQELFPAGTVLGPGHLGVLSSTGGKRVTVYPAPVVGVLSTGDELVDGPRELRPGQIRDSNRAVLLSLLRRDGFVGSDLGIAPDDPSVLEARLREGVARCNAVLTSGGVSMGEFDYVKRVLDRIGTMRWMQVAIRPAKPFAFGTVGDVAVFGLPGNPVSSMVSYEVLARPGLRRMAGHLEGDLRRPCVRAVVRDDLWRGAADGRVTFMRVRASFDVSGRLSVSSAGGQGSHQLLATAIADGLAVVAPGAELRAGDEVDVVMLNWPGQA